MIKTMYFHKGFRGTLSKVCVHFGVSKINIEVSMSRGISFEQAIAVEENRKQICKDTYHVSYKAVCDKMQKPGMSFEMAIEVIRNPPLMSHDPCMMRKGYGLGKTKRRLPNTPKPENEAGREF